MRSAIRLRSEARWTAARISRAREASAPARAAVSVCCCASVFSCSALSIRAEVSAAMRRPGEGWRASSTAPAVASRARSLAARSAWVPRRVSSESFAVSAAEPRRRPVSSSVVRTAAQHPQLPVQVRTEEGAVAPRAHQHAARVRRDVVHDRRLLQDIPESRAPEVGEQAALFGRLGAGLHRMDHGDAQQAACADCRRSARLRGARVRTVRHRSGGPVAGGCAPSSGLRRGAQDRIVKMHAPHRSRALNASSSGRAAHEPAVPGGEQDAASPQRVKTACSTSAARLGARRPGPGAAAASKPREDCRDPAVNSRPVS